MIRRPPRSTHTLSLHDALPISKSTRCQRLLPIVQREMLVLTLSILSGVNCSLRVAFLGLLLYALITRNFLSRGNAAQEWPAPIARLSLQTTQQAVLRDRKSVV